MLHRIQIDLNSHEEHEQHATEEGERFADIKTGPREHFLHDHVVSSNNGWSQYNTYLVTSIETITELEQKGTKNPPLAHINKHLVIIEIEHLKLN